MADQAWDIEAVGSVLDQWPAIVAAVSLTLPAHVAAVAFHAETGQLDLRPDSPAYATPTAPDRRADRRRGERLGEYRSGPYDPSTAGRIHRPDGQHGVRRPDRGQGPRGRARDAGQDVGGGVAGLPSRARRPPGQQEDPCVRSGDSGAAERQTREQAREPEQYFGDGQAAIEELRERAARTETVSSVAISWAHFRLRRPGLRRSGRRYPSTAGTETAEG
ncbi:hypothetical protein HRW23_34225 [Streptomyces lunaelactis]|uniref:hypothetical protein n=1 Tax=Streptomyces lunaelactis TaxID=1535768 RepID=UPI001584D37E|nr:hypothetical protein [Streptomyces lunaelactis]NUK02245.1 hypothetical protein [Streptomyces lunaelactis]NUK16109.1 hypothetical protein [Streptomyces lunaelactis]NUK34977.1 hypothetical protein [Streptomyces lunaelactis]NUK41715.1 hypothetical protein [Streptomyces lunaelactis]NUK82332.1 hypothetical protein [Streptomyces lunaelactis]